MDFHADAASVNFRGPNGIAFDSLLELLVVGVTTDNFAGLYTIEVQEEWQLNGTLSQNLARVTLLVRCVTHDEHPAIVLISQMGLSLYILTNDGREIDKLIIVEPSGNQRWIAFNGLLNLLGELSPAHYPETGESLRDCVLVLVSLSRNDQGHPGHAEQGESHIAKRLTIHLCTIVDRFSTAANLR